MSNLSVSALRMSLPVSASLGGYKAGNEKQESPFGFRSSTRGSHGTKKSFLRNLMNRNAFHRFA